jgi:hypothetical protein
LQSPSGLALRQTAKIAYALPRDFVSLWTAVASAQDVGVYVGGIGVGVGFGDIAYGYQDGYWDWGRHWHNWRNDQEMNDYRNYRGNHHNDYRHDRDHDMGWRN